MIVNLFDRDPVESASRWVLARAAAARCRALFVVECRSFPTPNIPNPVDPGVIGGAVGGVLVLKNRWQANDPGAPVAAMSAVIHQHAWSDEAVQFVSLLAAPS